MTGAARFLALLAAIIIAGLSPRPAEAGFVFDVNESVFTDLIGEVGPLSGSGTRRVTARAPCVPQFWRTCTVTVYNGTYTWNVRNPRVDISPSGVRFTGRVRFTYAGLTFNEDFSANVNLTVTDTRVRISVNRVSIPVHLNMPVVGNIRITTVRINPNLSVDAPFGGFSLVADNGQRARGGVRGVNVQFLNNFLRVSGQPVFN
ncbi:MAG: hypothetical protein NXH91_17365 [Phyllobacteriaceae bacterium]|nr:hypothetical protein [Phyllobacteriaceae bacterium]